jgi:hypothetical protein
MMDLPIHPYFDRAFSRREQNLPDFKDISGQNKLANPAHPRKDVPLVCPFFRWD